MDGHGETVVELILGALDPAVVVRVGPASDACVAELAADAARRGATFHVVDPTADLGAVDWEQYGEALVVHRAKCLNGLSRISGVDLLLVAGEHNWYTVNRALQFLEKRARASSHAFPLVVVTAVDWPYGRRDAYSDPESVPDAYRQPFQLGGLVPGQSEPVEEGGLEADVAHAIRDQGPRNGVRSAVEDFMGESELPLTFIDVPGLHGIGLLTTADHRRRRKLARVLKNLRSAEFLVERCRQIEESRLQAMLAAARLREESGRRGARVKSLKKHIAAQAEQMHAHAGRGEEMRGELAKMSAELGQRVRAHEEARRDHAATEQRVSELESHVQSRQREVDAAASRTQAAIEAGRRAEHEESLRRLALERELESRSNALRALELERDTVRERVSKLTAELNTQTKAATEERRARTHAEERASAAAREEAEARAELVEWTRREAEARRELVLAERQTLGRERELAVRQTELEAARRRLQRLDAELASRTRELDTSRTELEAGKQLLEGLKAEVASSTRELDTNRTELEAARQRLESLEAALGSGERELDARQTELEAARQGLGQLEGAAKQGEAQRSRLVEQAATLERQLQERNAELQSARAERQRLEAELETAAADRAQAEAKLAADGRRHDQIVSQMTLALNDVKGDLERLADSRVWRWGHRIACAIRRLTFRKPITEGAVAAAQRRIERIEEQRRALSAGSDPVGIVQSPSTSRATPAARATERPLSFCLKIGAPDWQAAARWGDLYFAQAVQRQLEDRGHGCITQVLNEWDAPDGLAYDVALHLKGTARYHTRPEQFNVLWSISHPAMLTGTECDGYDLVCVASERFAARLRSETRTPVIAIDQATDPEVFFPDHDPAFEHELVFVGNSRNVMRRILRDLLPTDRELAVFGGQWEGLIDKKYVLGDRVPNGDLRKVYSSAAIVLNDHWDDMRQHGFISNRIYDALACGAFIISDHVPELKQRFDGAVQTYGSPDELQQLIARYSSSPEERRQLGLRGRELVLDRHTFSHRVDDMLAAVRERITESDAMPLATR